MDAEEQKEGKKKMDQPAYRGVLDERGREGRTGCLRKRVASHQTPRLELSHPHHLLHPAKIPFLPSRTSAWWKRGMCIGH